ncbi:MAG: FtsH protease activity modulator HflK [Oceanospirillaceae bacterium]|jgi:membrane protease subunit HflK|nr:FtsH protease activity modulator HflK [Oceanospirillaceae bacterium]
MAWNEPGGRDDKNDPWSSGGNDRGGRRGGPGGNDQGPPDLDEALQKLQERLNTLFGGKKSGGSGGASSGGAQGGPGLGFIGVLALLAVVVWAGMGFYTVDQQERGVILRLGKFSETVQPGLQWNPPLVDDVTILNVTRVRTYDHRSLMLTRDENIVDVDMTIQYVVSDPKNYVLNVRDPEVSLGHASESSLRHTVGATDMDGILTEGRETLALEVQARLQRYMEVYGTGLAISRVNIKNATAPSQVQDAFDDVIKAREDEQRVKNQAESYANGIVPEARGTAQRVIEEANAYREEVIAKSTGEAERFSALLDAYRLAPDVTRERLYIETLQQVYANTPKVMMDSDASGNNMMYLPLDKLMERVPATSTSRSVRLDDNSLRQITDQVMQEVNSRSSSTSLREGR